MISGAIRSEQVMNIDEPVVCQVKRKFLAGFVWIRRDQRIGIEPFLICSGRLQNQDHTTAGDGEGLLSWGFEVEKCGKRIPPKFWAG